MILCFRHFCKSFLKNSHGCRIIFQKTDHNFQTKPMKARNRTVIPNRNETRLTRFLLSLCVSVLLAAAIISALPTKGEEQLYDRVVRLHVLANSDTEEDQALKLRVRDAILAYLNETSVACTDADSAEEAYRKQLPMLEGIAEKTLADAGRDGDCRVTLTRESYPVRTYQSGGETYTLPAGTYRSLRVMIGDAAGQNWWCVLFPPLCLSLAAELPDTREDAIPVAVYGDDGSIPTAEEQLLAAGFTPYEVSLISGEGKPKTVVKFRIVEFFRRMFEK